MINFCTLFDSNYLSRGLALYHSLCKVCPSFHLYIVAFNKESYQYLTEARLPYITPISLSEFEDEALLKVKATRSAAEYCWTTTPSVLLYCINKYQLPSCTYIDADMIFYQDPKVLLDEMPATDSILITEHRYSKDYDQAAISGKYCVQFMHFKNNEDGITALTWWRERCLEWCYARAEDGKFGDQKYLDDWTTRFKGVHVLQHRGGGVAPWNVQQFDIAKENNSIILVDKKSGKHYPLVFYHFHGVKFYTDNLVSCCAPVYDISSVAKEWIYIPYFKKLKKVEAQLKLQGISFNTNGAKNPAPGKLHVFLEYAKERLVLWKIGNIRPWQLKLFSFSKQYHFYKLDLLNTETNGPTDRP